MSLQQPAEDAAFFVGAAPEQEQQQQQLVLRKANAFASEDSLKEAIYWFSVALRCGPVRPEQLSTFVDCIVRKLKIKAASGSDSPSEQGQQVFDCPNCQSFLGDPVTLACGHSFCKRCVTRRLLSRCKVCQEAVRGDGKPNVILGGLLAKCFPGEAKRSKRRGQVDQLCARKRYRDAVKQASDLIRAEPETTKEVRLSRAEAYTSLKRFDLALEDIEFCLASGCSAEALFQKATVLRETGRADESLQVFLKCLAVDEDFPCAKTQVEKILCDLLSSADDNVKVGLRETAQNTSPLSRNKTLAAGAQVGSRSPVRGRSRQRVCAASAHRPTDEREKRRESLERPGLSRARSLRCHGPGCGERALKRVRSAPLLGEREETSLLKRKLSVSDTEPCVVASGSSKYKKQGVKTSPKTVAKAKMYPSVVEDLIDANDLECSLCLRLFYEPVTTPCGHTFCKSCLQRSLDHTAHCPLCKESLKEYLACRKYTVTSVLDALIKQYLRREYEERSKTHLEETRELSDLTKNVPIFVCTMAYPTVPCPLHVFEPRYRLMIRRCMDTGTRQFGMCINDPHKGFVDYGCMLIIRSVHFLPDGRSVVDTVGGKRFRVLSRGMKDGYSIADIVHLEDARVEDGEELESLQELHDAVYNQARVWFQNLKVRFHNQILQHFGPMPEREADIQATPNGPACCWWLLAVLPIDPRYQLSVLSVTSLKERLAKIQHILTYLQSVPSD
ncbi:LON peptidase N-terminal domain and ring finger 1, like isoform X2 [Phyllopteryx taeniolatus]|uniref:LON peptidase N-terminal domain and ring finger 1, like isoform X2 n=1 Tax=Phyllopteryx taeniolatus TaxID=161469 RepID=UPI002AD2E0A6|nr:LON peptidase N-terminal domain and ring finger 1, like isoform X2 [Phyllopteryx taeniolatus]